MGKTKFCGLTIGDNFTRLSWLENKIMGRIIGVQIKKEALARLQLPLILQPAWLYWNSEPCW